MRVQGARPGRARGPRAARSAGTASGNRAVEERTHAGQWAHDLRPRRRRARGLPRLLRLHRQHLPVADGRGGLPRPDRRAPARAARSRSVGRRPATGTSASAPTPAPSRRSRAHGYDAELAPRAAVRPGLVRPSSTSSSRSTAARSASCASGRPTTSSGKVQLLTAFDPESAGVDRRARPVLFGCRPLRQRARHHRAREHRALPPARTRNPPGSLMSLPPQPLSPLDGRYRAGRRGTRRVPLRGRAQPRPRAGRGRVAALPHRPPDVRVASRSRPKQARALRAVGRRLRPARDRRARAGSRPPPGTT